MGKDVQALPTEERYLRRAMLSDMMLPPTRSSAATIDGAVGETTPPVSRPAPRPLWRSRCNSGRLAPVRRVRTRQLPPCTRPPIAAISSRRLLRLCIPSPESTCTDLPSTRSMLGDFAYPRQRIRPGNVVAASCAASRACRRGHSDRVCMIRLNRNWREWRCERVAMWGNVTVGML